MDMNNATDDLACGTKTEDCNGEALAPESMMVDRQEKHVFVDTRINETKAIDIEECNKMNEAILAEDMRENSLTHEAKVIDKVKGNTVNEKIAEDAWKADEIYKTNMSGKEVGNIINKSMKDDKRKRHLSQKTWIVNNEADVIEVKTDDNIKQHKKKMQCKNQDQAINEEMILDNKEDNVCNNSRIVDNKEVTLNCSKQEHDLTAHMIGDQATAMKELTENETDENIKQENNPQEYVMQCDDTLLDKNSRKKQSLPCTFPGCSKNFSRPDRLRKHLLIHSNVRQFICGMISCGKSYTSAQHLRRHHKTAHAVSDSTEANILNFIPCDEVTCSRTFQTKFSMNKHYEKFHLNYRARYTCEICFTSFFYQAEYYKHMYDAHAVKVLMCDKCDIIFSSKTDKNRHMRGHRTWTCEEPECFGIVFDKYNEKRRHDAIVHPILYICHHCNFQAQRKFFLEEHMYSKHLPSCERPLLSCTYMNCKKSFHHERNYLQHYKKKHLNEASLYICPVGCPQTFATKQSCQRHVSKMHQGEGGNLIQKEEPNLPFSCDYCHKKFGKQLNVRRHILRVHTGHPRPAISKLVHSVFNKNYIPMLQSNLNKDSSPFVFKDKDDHERSTSQSD